MTDRLRRLVGLPLSERAARDAQIVRLQAAAFDHTGHVRRELGWTEAWEMIDRIDDLRRLNGFKPLDLTGRFYPEPQKETTS